MDRSSSQPWTASRCHRLLRPLLANIAVLRRGSGRVGNDGNSCLPDDTFPARSKRTSSESLSATSSSRPAKRTRFTYAGRGRSRSRRARMGDQPLSRDSSPDSEPVPTRQKLGRPHSGEAEAGGLVLPTPFLRRVRSQHVSSPPQPESPCAKKRGGLTTKRSDLDADHAVVRSVTDDARRQSSYLGILRALGKLLLATASQTGRPAWVGPSAAPKSLLAMCLRKVPDYIAALERQELVEAEENGTKSPDGSQALFDVYSDLESLGAVEGWQHLRTVVRSHGLRVLADGISEGLIELPFATVLARRATKHMALAECEVLVDALVLRQYPAPSGLNDSVLHSPTWLPLRFLFRDSALSLCPLGLAKLTHLLAQGLLPTSWLLTGDFVSIHATAVQALARRTCPQELLDFIATSLGLLCKMMSSRKGRPVKGEKQAARKKLVGMLEALSSMVLLANESAPGNASKSASDHASSLTRRVEYTIQTSLAALEGESRGQTQLPHYLLSVSGFLVAGTACYRQSITSAWGYLEDKNHTRPWAEHYDATISLICAIANCCSRGACTRATPAHASLLRLCDRLAELPLPGQPLGSIRADGAFHLANISSDLRDLVFAENLGAEASTMTSVNPGQSADVRRQRTNPSFSGFRWDKDISEWVTESPLTGRRRRPSRPRLRRLSAAHESFAFTETRHSDTNDYQASHESPRSAQQASETSTENFDGRDTSVLADDESVFSSASPDSTSVTPSESISDDIKETLDGSRFSGCKVVANRIMALAQDDGHIPDSRGLRRHSARLRVRRAEVDFGEKDELCSDRRDGAPGTRRTLGKVAMGLRCSGNFSTRLKAGAELFPHDSSDDELGS